MLAGKGETPLLKTQRWTSSESPWRHWLTHRQPIFQTQTHILVQESVNNRGLALLHENEQYLWEEWNQWAPADSVLLSILLHYQCSDEEKPEKHGTDFLLLSCCPWFFWGGGGRLTRMLVAVLTFGACWWAETMCFSVKRWDMIPLHLN